MKRKNKALAMAEIAIVLCSTLLVSTLPAIAADQTEEPLAIYGNANEDDTIDMRDTTYIKLVIFGKKPETDLADANYDGKISMLDVGQTKLIILGKEKKLTFIDLLGEAVTVTKPIKRLVGLGNFGFQVTREIGATNLLVGVIGYFFTGQKILYPEISKLPIVGTWDNYNYEMVLSLKPDAVWTNLDRTGAIPGGLEKKRMHEEKLPGIPLISLNMRNPLTFSKDVRTYGYIIDREDEAEELTDWYDGWYINILKARTEGLSEDKKPRIYFESNPGKPYKCVASGSRIGVAINLAGGKNIVDETICPDDPGYGSIGNEVDPEWVIEQNPEFIFIRGKADKGGYETDDSSDYAAVVQEILDRPELATVDAVKNKRVYVLTNQLISGGSNTITGALYMAKSFHPELFEDIDSYTVHQEYVDKFCRIDFNVKEQGVFMYPPPKWSQ